MSMPRLNRVLLTVQKIGNFYRNQIWLYILKTKQKIKRKQLEKICLFVSHPLQIHWKHIIICTKRTSLYLYHPFQTVEAPLISFGRSVGLLKTLMGNQGCKTSYSCTFHGSIVQISFH